MGVQGSLLQVHGAAEVQIGLETERFNAKVVIVENLTTQEAILGKDFLKQSSCITDVEKGTLHFAAHGVTLPFCTSVDEQPAKRRQHRNREKCDQGARKKSRRNQERDKANFVGVDLGYRNVNEKRGHVMPRRNQ